MPPLEHSSCCQPLAHLTGRRSGHRQELRSWNLVPYGLVLYLPHPLLRLTPVLPSPGPPSYGCSVLPTHQGAPRKRWSPLHQASHETPPPPFLTQHKLLLQPNWGPGQGQSSWNCFSAIHAATSLTALSKVRVSNVFIFKCVCFQTFSWDVRRKGRAPKGGVHAPVRQTVAISFPFVCTQKVCADKLYHSWMVLVHAAAPWSFGRGDPSLDLNCSFHV